MLSKYTDTTNNSVLEQDPGGFETFGQIRCYCLDPDWIHVRYG